MINKFLKIVFVTWLSTLFLVLGLEVAYSNNIPDRDSMVKNLDWVYDLDIDSSVWIRENIYSLFAPWEDGQLRIMLRVIWVGVFIVFTIWIGFRFVIYADNETERQKAQKNLIYLGYWALLFFGASWIIGTLLNVPWLEWVGSDGWLTGQIVWNKGLLFQVFRLFKAWAFFVSIVMLVYYWLRMMQAYEQEDKITQAKNGIMNVSIALIFMKVIEYIYYIASKENFRDRAWDLILRASRWLWWVVGVVMVFSILFAWIKLITSRWDEESISSAKRIISSVFVVGLMIMLFMLIVHNLATSFAW